MSVKLYILPNVKGGKYTGTLDEKKQPHGVGSLRFDNGHFYEGQWQHGEVTGKGEAIGAPNPATAVYEHIANSVIDKHVKKDEESSSLVSENAATASNSAEKKPIVHYNGEWRDGRMEGYGTYTFENGDIFDGEWRYNRPNGNGIYKYKATGDEFVGSFVNGQRSGKGIYKHATGASYDGQWHQDLRHGKGLEIFSSGNKFEGYWVKDKRHGKGLYFVQRMEPPTGESSASTTTSSSNSGKEKKNNRKSLWNWGLGNPAKRHASAPPSLTNAQKDQRRKSIFNYLFATSSQHADQVFEEDPLYIIYEHVWEYGQLKSEKELKGKPALFPEPPEELEEIVLLNQLEESGKSNQKTGSFAEKVEIVEDLPATPSPATPTVAEEKAGKLAKMKFKKKNAT